MTAADYSSARVMTPQRLTAATQPTLYFIGVTTGRSSIQRVFPRWATQLGLIDAVLVGIDVPIHADRETYRRVVSFIKTDPLSRGALVTTHKIDLYRACEDLFDSLDLHARAMGEVSCLSKRGGGLVGHAKDPITAGLALDAFVPSGYWSATGAEAILLGAGGSTIAISWYLSLAERGRDRPSRIVVSNRSQARLDHLHEVYGRFGSGTPVSYVLAPEASINSALVASAVPGSLVVNATGLGKDAPGSPLDESVRFPQGAYCWDLNYRGDLVFLDQATSQAEARDLRIEDGWTYFLHGWTHVIGEVFDIRIPASGPDFDVLSDLASDSKSGLVSESGT